MDIIIRLWRFYVWKEWRINRFHINFWIYFQIYSWFFFLFHGRGTHFKEVTVIKNWYYTLEVSQESNFLNFLNSFQEDTFVVIKPSLREKYPHSDFLWSVFSGVFSLNAGKYGQEKLWIGTHFRQGIRSNAWKYVSPSGFSSHFFRILFI